MAKDPAINWYFDNWGGGTFGMSRFHKGCYMDLLSAQYHIGHLSLEQIKNILGNDFSAWQVLQSKFVQDENKNFFNERLAAEVRKREKYSESRSRNRKKNICTNISKSYDEHMLNIPETGTETGIDAFEKGAGKTLKNSPKIEEVERVFLQQGGTREQALYFFNQYESVEWKMKGQDIKNFSSLVGNFIRNWHKNNTKNGNNINQTGNKSNRDRQSAANADLINELRGIITG